jgi:hypothetical protein
MIVGLVRILNRSAFQMNTATAPRLSVTADGKGFIAHAGSLLLADLAEATGLETAFPEARAVSAAEGTGTI